MLHEISVLVKYTHMYILGHDVKCIFYFELPSKVGKPCTGLLETESCSPPGNKKAQDKLTWVATVGCPVLFISLIIDEL